MCCEFGDGRSHLLCRRHQRVHRHEPDPGVIQPELAFLPIGDLFTMSPKEAAAGLQAAATRSSDPDALRDLPRPNRPSGGFVRFDLGPSWD